MQFITRPLENWTRKDTKKRTEGGYGVSYSRCLDLLEKELVHLGVTGDVIIQIDMPEAYVRRDGLPYGDRKPNTPRVALAFVSKMGPMTYTCDAHHDWRDNLRAICLGLERLRLVERTGIISRGEQYTGFRALPAGIPLGPGPINLEDAARLVATAAAPLVEQITDPVLRLQARTVGAAGVLREKAVFDCLYRLAAKSTHPDGGNDSPAWHRLQEAAAVLEKHFEAGDTQ